MHSRAESLAAIDTAMARIATRLGVALKGSKAAPSRLHNEGIISKLVVRLDGVQIKIEITPVLRGCVYEPVVLDVSPGVENRFGFAQARLVSFPDLYAGKIVAALDRQHPRDLFDVRALLAAEGVDDALRGAFIVYMLSHNRPLGEVLAPARKDLTEEFQRGFEGMTLEPVALDDLLAAREAIIAVMVGQMPKAHRRFLLGFKQGAPDWGLLGVPQAARLPAVLWKQQNLERLPAAQRAELLASLERALS